MVIPPDIQAVPLIKIDRKGDVTVPCSTEASTRIYYTLSSLAVRKVRDEIEYANARKNPEPYYPQRRMKAFDAVRDEYISWNDIQRAFRRLKAITNRNDLLITISRYAGKETR